MLVSLLDSQIRQLIGQYKSFAAAVVASITVSATRKRLLEVERINVLIMEQIKATISRYT